MFREPAILNIDQDALKSRFGDRVILALPSELYLLHIG